MFPRRECQASDAADGTTNFPGASGGGISEATITALDVAPNQLSATPRHRLRCTWHQAVRKSGTVRYAPSLQYTMTITGIIQMGTHSRYPPTASGWLRSCRARQFLMCSMKHQYITRAVPMMTVTGVYKGDISDVVHHTSNMSAN